jgi:SanA protein
MAWPISLLKRIVKGLIWAGFWAVVVILLCNLWVVQSARSQNYYTVASLPSNDVALVLGTSKSVYGGLENLFFRYRMEAAARLYHEGKIKHLILSGNNDSQFYNEPLDMQRALVRLGVPKEVMRLDYVGKRTYDSVIRSRVLFGQNRITIVSQPFHNARALFIARHSGVEAIAFAAQDVPDGYSLRTLVREYLARPKAILDVYLLEPEIARHNRAIERKRKS